MRKLLLAAAIVLPLLPGVAHAVLSDDDPENCGAPLGGDRNARALCYKVNRLVRELQEARDQPPQTVQVPVYVDPSPWSETTTPSETAGDPRRKSLAH